MKHIIEAYKAKINNLNLSLKMCTDSIEMEKQKASLNVYKRVVSDLEKLSIHPATQEGEDVRKEAVVSKVKELLLFCENHGEVVQGFRTIDIIQELRVLCSTLPYTPPVSSQMEHTEPSGIDKEEETVTRKLRLDKLKDILNNPSAELHEKAVEILNELNRGNTVTEGKEDIKSFTFEELVQYGLNSGTIHIHDGMPWSFDYKGIPISHENNECYIIPWKGINNRFTPADVLIIDSRRNVSVIRKSDLEKFQNALFPPSEPSTIPVVDYEKESMEYFIGEDGFFYGKIIADSLKPSYDYETAKPKAEPKHGFREGWKQAAVFYLSMFRARQMQSPSDRWKEYTIHKDGSVTDKDGTRATTIKDQIASIFDQRVRLYEGKILGKEELIREIEYHLIVQWWDFTHLLLDAWRVEYENRT